MFSKYEEEDASRAENVNFLIISLTREYLRCQISMRPTLLIKFSSLWNESGNSKVIDNNMFFIVFILEQDILRFHVSVDDALLVDDLESLEDALHQLQGLQGRQEGLVQKALVEVSPFAVVHYYL